MSEFHDDTEFPVAQTVDARHLSCPMPLLKAKQAIRQVGIGEVIAVYAHDAGALRDIPAWCKQAGQQLLSMTEQAGEYQFRIRRLL